MVDRLNMSKYRLLVCGKIACAFRIGHLWHWNVFDQDDRLAVNDGSGRMSGVDQTFNF